jgi:hypothetical protein
MRDSSGKRRCDSRLREGLVIRASGVSDQKNVECECSVRACRRAGIRDQDVGLGEKEGR